MVKYCFAFVPIVVVLCFFAENLNWIKCGKRKMLKIRVVKVKWAKISVKKSSINVPMLERKLKAALVPSNFY